MIKEFTQAITELSSDKDFKDELKAAFYGSMIKELREDIAPQFHNQYDFDGVSSVVDVTEILINARDSGHLVKQ